MKQSIYRASQVEAVGTNTFLATVCRPVGEWTFNASYSKEDDGRDCYSLVMTTPGQPEDEVWDFHLHCETPEELEREFCDMMIGVLRSYRDHGRLPHIDWQAIRDFRPAPARTAP